MSDHSFADILAEALATCDLTVTQAARLLSVHRSTVYRWLQGALPSAEQRHVLADLPLRTGMPVDERERFLAGVAEALGFQLRRYPLPSPPPVSIANRRHLGTDILLPFAGREIELATLGDHLARGRSVAIIGAGGVGKTRLAQELLARSFRHFTHGCETLTLAPGQTGAQVIGHVARLIGVDQDETVTQGDGRAALAALRARMPQVKLLFLLDDVDHPDQVRDLVRGLPGVTWLLTGRSTRLAQTISVSRRLRPPDTTGAIAILLAHCRFAPLPDREDTTTAARIVERLGRLPLAITLAAGLLANEQLGSLAELDAWLVAGGLARRGAAAVRLRHFFEQMIDSLPPAAGRAFELCGAFAGPTLSPVILRDVGLAAGLGCPAEACEALADYGLTETGIDGRIQFHSLLREYARDRLRVAPHAAAIHAAYLAHYVALAERVGRPPETERDYRPLVAEEQELLAVAEALHAAGDWAWLQRLYQALTGYLWRAGNRHAYAQVDHWCLDAADGLGDEEWTVKILSELGYARKEAGEWDEAETLFQRCQTLYDAAPERFIDRARLRRYRAEVALGRGDANGALLLLAEVEELLARAAKTQPPNLALATMLFHSARMTVHHRRGALEEAEADGRVAEQLFQATRSYGEFRVELGDILLCRGKPDQAARLWQAELDSHTGLPDAPEHTEARLRLAWLWAGRGESERAREAAMAAAEAFGRHGQTARATLAEQLLAALERGGAPPDFIKLSDSLS